MKSSSEIRSAFLNYFKSVGHEVVSSSPLPQKDNPTLLFTNAGMNQFANTFIECRTDLVQSFAEQRKLSNDLTNLAVIIRCPQKEVPFECPFDILPAFEIFTSKNTPNIL